MYVKLQFLLLSATALLIALVLPEASTAAVSDAPHGGQNCPVSVGDSYEKLRRTLGEPKSVAGWAQGPKTYFYEYPEKWQGKIVIKNNKVTDIYTGDTLLYTPLPKYRDEADKKSAEATENKKSTGTEPKSAAKPSTIGNKQDKLEKEDAGVQVLDDFSTGADWSPIAWHNANSCEIKRVQKKDQWAMRITAEKGDKVKTGVVRVYPNSLDLSGVEKVSYRIELTSERPAPVVAAFWTDAYYETRKRTLSTQGVNTLTFKLNDKNFKAESTDWNYGATLENKQAVRKLYLLLYTRKSFTAHVYRITAE